MKVTFIGGGSLRLIPILRGVMAECPQVFEDAELRFFDLHQDRAQAVMTLLQHSPEFRNAGKCHFVCPETLDDALKNIDICYLTMGIRREPQTVQAAHLCNEVGLISTDQLSLTGAFWGVQLGKIVCGIAEKLAKLSPDALMLIFANPVAVYSCMIERFLGVNALGICGGFNNHRYDLSRLFGKDEYTKECDVVAAGVSHLSFILRGTFKGEDIYQSAAPRLLHDSWKNIFDNNFILHETMDLMRQIYCKHKYLVFSTEIDGIYYLAPEKISNLQKKLLPPSASYNPVESGKAAAEKVENNFRILLESAKGPLTDEIYSEKNPLFTANTRDISVPIFKACANIEKMRIVASGMNNGVIAGMPAEAAVEYTIDIEGKKITPVENQFIPAPFVNIVSSLSEFQTLLGEAIVKHDHRIFASALEAYPFCKKDVVGKLFGLFKDIIDSEMQKASKLFTERRV